MKATGPSAFPKAKTSRGGWSLVESLVSTLLLAMSGAVLSTAFLQSMRFGEMSSDYYGAVTIAKNRIERARAFEFRDLPLLAESDVRLDCRGVPDPYGKFTRTTEVDMSHGPSLGRIVATVAYPIPGRDGRGNVSIVTLLTERNPGGCSE